MCPSTVSFHRQFALYLRRNRNYIGKVTGGVSATLEMISVKPTNWDDDSRVLPGVNMLTVLFIKGKCTMDKISDLFHVFKMVLTLVNFDDSKSILQNALKSSLSSKKSDVANRGHSYVNTRIRGRYSIRCKSDYYFASQMLLFILAKFNLFFICISFH